ncbi:MAG: helix-turn-helix domain-containing protein [Lachnospiraceae bacterium]|nr:helix-turn-helix domain-containing protein [Lachnospiraceae bacterium]
MQQEPEIDYEQLGKRIQQARKESNMTQEELSGRCNISTSYLSRCENGNTRISLPLLYKIGVQTGRGVDYFLMDSPSSDPSIKINNSIGKLLLQCSAEMLTLVEHFLQGLLNYDQSIRKRLE